MVEGLVDVAFPVFFTLFMTLSVIQSWSALERQPAKIDFIQYLSSSVFLDERIKAAFESQ